MAQTVVGQLALNLSDWASRNVDGKVASIVEIMKQTNQILDDMLFVEANSTTGHVTTIRSGLPTVAWRILNYGVQPSKSRTVKVTDTWGMLEAFSRMDADLAALNGNTAEFRLSEESSFIESMNQEFASTLFYGNTQTDAKKFLGLAPRFDSLSAENGENIIDAGGTGSDNTSIWLLCWGDQTLHGIFPKGGASGLRMEDLGKKEIIDEEGGEYMGYKTHYKWDVGLTLRNWRYIVRIANIDVTKLSKIAPDVDSTSDATKSADLIDLIVTALELVPGLEIGKFALYANKTITSYLRRQISNKSNAHLSLEQVGGKRVLTFDGIPVRKCDAILSAEDRVV